MIDMLKAITELLHLHHYLTSSMALDDDDSGVIPDYMLTISPICLCDPPRVISRHTNGQPICDCGGLLPVDYKAGDAR